MFTGNILGHKSDIADGSLRGYEFRKFENIVGDYYVSPRFLDAVTVSWLPGRHSILYIATKVTQRICNLQTMRMRELVHSKPEGNHVYCRCTL